MMIPPLQSVVAEVGAEPNARADGDVCHGPCSEQHAPSQPPPSLSLDVRQNMKSVIWLLSLAAVFVAIGCSFGPPNITVTVNNEHGKNVFVFQHQNHNGLVGLSIWTVPDDALLWDINLRYFSGERLIYGEVPKGFTSVFGNQENAIQRFPTSGQTPAPLPANARLRMELSIQYDTSTSASGRSFFYDVVTDGIGNIVLLEPIQDLSSLTVPKRTFGGERLK